MLNDRTGTKLGPRARSLLEDVSPRVYVEMCFQMNCTTDLHGYHAGFATPLHDQIVLCNTRRKGGLDTRTSVNCNIIVPAKSGRSHDALKLLSTQSPARCLDGCMYMAKKYCYMLQTTIHKCLLESYRDRSESSSLSRPFSSIGSTTFIPCIPPSKHVPRVESLKSMRVVIGILEVILTSPAVHGVTSLTSPADEAA